VFLLFFQKNHFDSRICVCAFSQLNSQSQSQPKSASCEVMCLLCLSTCRSSALCVFSKLSLASLIYCCFSSQKDARRHMCLCALSRFQITTKMQQFKEICVSRAPSSTLRHLQLLLIISNITETDRMCSGSSFSNATTMALTCLCAFPRFQIPTKMENLKGKCVSRASPHSLNYLLFMFYSSKALSRERMCFASSFSKVYQAVGCGCPHFLASKHIQN
jgi:hypothetical protein